MALLIDVLIFLKELSEFDIVFELLFFHLMYSRNVILKLFQIVNYLFLIFYKFVNSFIHLNQLAFANGFGGTRERQFYQIVFYHVACCYCLERLERRGDESLRSHEYLHLWATCKERLIANGFQKLIQEISSFFDKSLIKLTLELFLRNCWYAETRVS